MFERKHNGYDSGSYNYSKYSSSQIKAELLRRDLLSRKDLMQMYRPPLKRAERAENNPFIARTMVEAPKVNFSSAAILPTLFEKRVGS